MIDWTGLGLEKWTHVQLCDTHWDTDIRLR